MKLVRRKIMENNSLWVQRVGVFTNLNFISFSSHDKLWSIEEDELVHLFYSMFSVSCWNYAGWDEVNYVGKVHYTLESNQSNTTAFMFSFSRHSPPRLAVTTVSIVVLLFYWSHSHLIYSPSEMKNFLLSHRIPVLVQLHKNTLLMVYAGVDWWLWLRFMFKYSWRQLKLNKHTNNDSLLCCFM